MMDNNQINNLRKELKEVSILLLSGVIFSLVFYLYFKGHNLPVSDTSLKSQLDSLKKHDSVRESKIMLLQWKFIEDSVRTANIKIKNPDTVIQYTKVKYHEKADSIISLPFDSKLNILSIWLSEEDSL